MLAFSHQQENLFQLFWFKTIKMPAVTYSFSHTSMFLFHLNQNHNPIINLMCEKRGDITNLQTCPTDLKTKAE